MAAASAARQSRHETRALLRAHLAAASRYGHITRHCPVCHRLLRLAMDAQEPVEVALEGLEAREPEPAVEDESPTAP
ncbi:DUF6274 family protein [Streptomyces sp. NPDC008121]|uniref:DUF6274 family protein n=1 Tax=Streptomyces sp. NPDC008121 TaxID=3364809 RepID=UPI0036E43DB9